ncbi:MAG: serine/threonine protein kinase [Gemmatimonadetes bacterium]|nr:serine/threonine protein kinase [Gemmatimonadota bacterium]
MTRWSPERWAAVKAIFHDLTQLPDAERAAALLARTAGDAEAREAIGRMLQHATRDHSRLDQGAAGLMPSLKRELPQGSLPVAGTRVGAFEIVREVGRGGMGVVYEAVRVEDTGIARVAIKVLPPTRAETVFARRFVSEQRLLQQLDHAGIARFVDSGWTSGQRPWFAMAYVDGVPLDQWCTTQGVPPADRVRLVRDTCRAVQHAHDRQVLHRDIKPSNILVTATGQTVLVDFGIARTLDDDAPGTLTLAGFRPMSLSFASPEHLAGRPLTAAADVFSLGAVLYVLLAGQPPTSRRVPPSTAASPRDAEAVVPFDDCVMRALAHDPLARYPSAEALAQALDAVLGSVA